jgi:hypothetical protein
MYAFTTGATVDANETTTITAPASQETTPMVGSKRAASEEGAD